MTIIPVTQENAVKLQLDFMDLIGKPLSSHEGLNHIKIAYIKIVPLPKGMRTVLLYAYTDSAKVDVFHRQLIDYLKEEGIEFDPKEYGL